MSRLSWHHLHHGVYLVGCCPEASLPCSWCWTRQHPVSSKSLKAPVGWGIRDKLSITIRHLYLHLHVFTSLGMGSKTFVAPGSVAGSSGYIPANGFYPMSPTLGTVQSLYKAGSGMLLAWTVSLCSPSQAARGETAAALSSSTCVSPQTPRGLGASPSNAI